MALRMAAHNGSTVSTNRMHMHDGNSIMGRDVMQWRNGVSNARSMMFSGDKNSAQHGTVSTKPSPMCTQTITLQTDDAGILVRARGALSNPELSRRWGRLRR